MAAEGHQKDASEQLLAGVAMTIAGWAAEGDDEPSVGRAHRLHAGGIAGRRSPGYATSSGSRHRRERAHAQRFQAGTVERRNRGDRRAWPVLGEMEREHTAALEQLDASDLKLLAGRPPVIPRAARAAPGRCRRGSGPRASFETSFVVLVPVERWQLAPLRGAGLRDALHPWLKPRATHFGPLRGQDLVGLRPEALPSSLLLIDPRGRGT